jgi:hypothetical protein
MPWGGDFPALDERWAKGARGRAFDGPQIYALSFFGERQLEDLGDSLLEPPGFPLPLQDPADGGWIDSEFLSKGLLRIDSLLEHPDLDFDPVHGRMGKKIALPFCCLRCHIPN